MMKKNNKTIEKLIVELAPYQRYDVETEEFYLRDDVPKEIKEKEIILKTLIENEPKWGWD